MNKKNVYPIIVTVLLVLTIIAGIVLMTKNSSIQGSNEEYLVQMDSLNSVKTELLSQLDQLQGEYEQMAALGDSLSGNLEGAKAEIAKLERIRDQSATDIKSLQKQISQLGSLRDKLETNISQLRQENAELLARNEALGNELATTQAINDTLNSQNQALTVSNQNLSGERDRLKLANIKASDFQVNVEGRREKVTSKGRSARRINISFDLANIPAEFQGPHTVYLVLTDANAMPLVSANPVRARITTDGQISEIQAQQVKEVDFTSEQRIQFIQDLEDKLQAGVYQASIYSDLGFLGSTSFRVN